MAAAGVYPVHVEASLDPPLSRWLWLFKWILLIPHYFVLAFLWLAFTVLSIIAFFAILFTGGYPRAIFDFNVGVLRWTWRVQYYAIGAFGTDRYPPFTLAEVPGYPAHLEIDYPDRLSRGLVLVKWWLLAIPHYIIIGLFTGGGVWFAWRYADTNYNWGSIGLIGILALIAAVVVLFTGRYPDQIFDFVLGMNRWVLRVAAYAGLMTDKYPPFRLDMGGHEPGSVLTVPPPGPPGSPAPEATPPPASPQAPFAPPQPGPSSAQIPGAPFASAPPAAPPTTPYAPPGPSGTTALPPAPPPTPMPPQGRRQAWTTGRIVSVVIGSVLLLVSLGFLGAGGAAVWANTAARQGGYVDLGTTTYSTGGYALASDTVSLHTVGTGWDAAKSLFGTVRLRVQSVSGPAPVFVGIATADAGSRYLAGVQYATVSGPGDRASSYTLHSGTAPTKLPGRAGVWTAKASGTGTQTLTWPIESGDWIFVAMNASGTQPVNVKVNVAATLPSLPWIATGLLAAGVILLAGGVVLIAVPLHRASR
ncbi:MAG: DUF4389 domain-containing protein [Micromonosporaceae bacterium]